MLFRERQGVKKKNHGEACGGGGGVAAASVLYICLCLCARSVLSFLCLSERRKKKKK